MTDRSARELAVRVFPDAAYANRELLNASLIYFGHVVVPPLHYPRSYIERDSDIAKQLAKWGADIDSALRSNEETLELQEFLRELLSAGVVSQLPSEAPNDATQFDTVLMKALNDPTLESLFQSAADGAQHWLGQGFTIHGRQTDEDKAIVRRIKYLQGATEATQIARELGHNITTFSHTDYEAVRALQSLTSDSTDRNQVESLELVRLVLPRLVLNRAEEVLEVRDRLSQFLDPFRIEIARLSSSLPLDLAPSQMKDELARAVDREVTPRIAELRRFLSHPARQLARHIIPDSSDIGMAGLTLYGAVSAGLPPGPVLLAAPLMHLLKSALEARSERLEMREKNPFTFALLAED